MSKPDREAMLDRDSIDLSMRRQMHAAAVGTFRRVSTQSRAGS